MNNKKNWADWGGCYLQRPKAQVDNTLRDLLNSSYPTKAEFIDCFFIHSRYFLVRNIAKTCLPAATLSLTSIVYVLSSSANIIQIADVALRVVFLLFLLYFLAIISPSSSCSSYSWNEWCPPFYFSQRKQLSRVPRSSRLTVHSPVQGCIFDVIFSLNIKFFKIWSSVTGYVELCVCFQLIRIGEIFWVNNNTNMY